jgi:hypothetical protein
MDVTMPVATDGRKGRAVRRLFWLAMGVTIGALVVRKLARTAESLSPRGIAASVSESLAGLLAAVREFAADVREGMTEREAELTEGTGLDGRLGARPEDF